MKIDNASEKIRKIAQTIAITCVGVGVLRVVLVFGLGNTFIDNKLLHDQMIPYLIGGGSILSGIISGIWIKENLSGKIVYGILSSILTIIPAALAILFSVPFAGP